MAKKAAPQYPVNAALEAAVIARADEDAPRLVYADWLDENGDPNRAAFIRTQCALWEKDPADPDYIDLVERITCLMPAMTRRLLRASRNTPAAFWPDGTDEGRDCESAGFHRGFPYLADGLSRGDLHEHLPERVEKELLADVVRTTTIRGLALSDRPPGRLAKLLATRAAQKLTCLQLDSDGGGGSSAIETLLASPVAASLRWLVTGGFDHPRDLRALAKAKTLDRLNRLVCAEPGDGSAAIWKQFRQVLATDWFGRLRSFTLNAVTDAKTLAPLADHPRLHTLAVAFLWSEAARGEKELRALPALGCLSLTGQTVPPRAGAALAGLDLPRLAVLELVANGLTDEIVGLLASSPLFARLTRLSLRNNAVGQKGAAAVTKCASAPNLRQLDLGLNPLGKAALAAVLKPGAFPKLTTLVLREPERGKIPAPEMAGLLGNLHLPELRHLDLTGWSVGDAGAKALAKNSALANLKILELGGCEIGPSGIAALAASPHLRGLVKLDLSGCTLKSKVALFADKSVLPGLAYLGLPEDVPVDAKDRLFAARPEISPDD